MPTCAPPLFFLRFAATALPRLAALATLHDRARRQHPGRVSLAATPPRRDSRGMSEIAGSLGDGRVLVLQPATPNGAGLDIALGIQRFWQKTLKNAGRPAATIMALM